MVEKNNVFVALGCVSGKPTIGKVHNTTRYFGSDDGRERRVTDEDFYVLCMEPEAEYEWVKYTGDGKLPGEELNFRDVGKVRIGRGKTGRALTTGIVVCSEDSHVFCALYDGRVNNSNEFEVLVVKPKEMKVKLEFKAASKASKNEAKAKFHLEKQEEVPERMGQPRRPALYLTNPEGTEEIILAEPDGSFGQIWHWSQDMLLCDTGKALDISADGVVAKAVHGRDSQRFYPFKLTSPMTEKEYLFMGRLSEKDEDGKPTAKEKVFLSVPKDDGKATMKPIDAFYLYDVAATNAQNTIQQCWDFAYREIDASDKGIKSKGTAPKESSSPVKKGQEANLGDLMGLMAGLAAAFSPPEQQQEIEENFNQLGQAMGGMLGGLAEMSKALTHSYTWEKMDSNKLPENALAGGNDGGKNNVFVALGCVSGKPTIGKVHNTTRYFGSDDGRERRVTDEDFYVLCMEPEAEYEWVKYTGDGKLPGEELNFRDIGMVRIGRGKTGKALTPGIVVSSEDSHVFCALYDGRVNNSKEFEVLVVKSKEMKVKLEFNAATSASKNESMAKFHLEKQEEVPERMGQPRRPALYLTNPEGTDEIILAEPDGSFGQIWHWSQDMLLCDTGKALDISSDGVVANIVHGGESQRLYPFKLTSPTNEKEYLFIGRRSDLGDDGQPALLQPVFVWVPKDQGKATMKPIDAGYLYDVIAKNPNANAKTLEHCWEFAYRQIDASEKGIKLKV